MMFQYSKYTFESINGKWRIWWSIKGGSASMVFEDRFAALRYFFRLVGEYKPEPVGGYYDK